MEIGRWTYLDHPDLYFGVLAARQVLSARLADHVFGDVYRIDKLRVGIWIWKLDVITCGRAKNFLEMACKRRIGGVIGPEGESSAGF